MNAIFHLDESIRQEFTVEADGKAFASRRAIARLCDVDHTTILSLLENLAGGKPPSKMLESFAGKSFEAGGKLPDLLVAAIVQHYAFKGRLQAQITATAFAAIGFRLWIQSELGWSAGSATTPTTPLGLAAAITQEMVKLEEQVNKQGQVITQLTNQVNQLAQALATSKTAKRSFLPDGVTADLEKVLSLVQRKGGTLSVREFQHSIASRCRPRAQTVKQWFTELEVRGYGKTTVTGKTYSFTIRPQLTVLS
jgi:hypothetical protein